MPRFTEIIRNLERESATLAALMLVATPSAALSVAHFNSASGGHSGRDADSTGLPITGVGHPEVLPSTSAVLAHKATLPGGAAALQPAMSTWDGASLAGPMGADPLRDGASSIPESLQSDYLDMSGSGDAAPVASTAPSLTDGIGTSDLAVDGFSGLIGRLLEQAEQAQADLSGEFNGERQGLVRGFIDDVGQQLNQSTHDFFQQSVRGEVKGLLMDVVDHSGSSALQQATDPLFAVDYYGASSALINNGLSALPISNLALPQIGPLLTHPQSELADYLSR